VDFTHTESKTNSLDDILQERLEKAFHKQTSKVHLHEIAKIASEHSPIDLAYAALHLPLNVRPVLYENLPNRKAKLKFILNTDHETRTGLFREMNDKELKKVFEMMPTDEAVWVMEDMSERRFRKVIGLIDAKKAAKICEQKRHARNSAGRLMTSDFFAFTMDMTIGEASLHIRDNPSIDLSKGIFILNEAGELLGFVAARNMIINPEDTPLRRVMRPILHKVSPEATREEVIDIVERYKVSSLPVTDMDNFLVGVISYDDVVEAMEDSADEMMAHIAGTKEKVEAHEPVLRRFTARSPWLVVTLIAGIVNVGVMSAFQQYEKGLLTFVLFFVPLITGMSGNIGIQCSTVLVRNIATGMFSASSRKDMIYKELCSGLLTGLIFGIGCGVLTYFLNYFAKGGIGAAPITVAMIVGFGLIGACFAGTLLGVFSPLFFYKIGVDPAVSSGPIVTAFNDTFSMTIYFLIAWSVSNLFF